MRLTVLAYAKGIQFLRAGLNRGTFAALSIGILIIGGAQAFSTRASGESVSGNPLLQNGWVSQAGAGLIAPACGSSATIASCSGHAGALQVSFNFGSCALAQVTMNVSNGASQQISACSGTFTFTGLSSGGVYNYSLQYAHNNGQGGYVTETDSDTITIPSC